MATLVSACLERVALLRPSQEPSELSDAFLVARGTYLSPSLSSSESSSPGQLVLAASPTGTMAIPLDYALPIGPQIDLLQLACEKETLQVYLLPVASLSPATGAGFSAAPSSLPNPQPIGPTAKHNALQSAKCSLFFRYKHPRDVLSLNSAEETALASVGWDKRADLASAMSKLYGRDAGAGVPFRIFALVEPATARNPVATTVLRQCWVPFHPPASPSGSTPEAASTSPATSSGAVTLTTAIMTCLQIAEKPAVPHCATVCMYGHTMTFPSETDEVDLPSFVPRLLMPDGFVYVACMLKKNP
jgi:hypothetical protein